MESDVILQTRQHLSLTFSLSCKFQTIEKNITQNNVLLINLMDIQT